MSCSTSSLLAGTITTNTLSIEDPYIFTETVPTTPPLLFSNSQKSRNRFEVKQNLSTTNTTTITTKAPITQTLTTSIATTTATNKESSYVKLKNYGTQTQTSSSSPSLSTLSTKVITTTTTITPANVQQQQLQQHQHPQTAVLGVLNTNNIKYEPKTTTTKLQDPQQQLQQQQLRQTKNAQHIFTTSQNENFIAKQQQQQQKQQQQQHSQKTLSTTPPPLLLSHTPSLWQTPLLLENSTTTGPTNNTIQATTKTTTTIPPANHSLSIATKEKSVRASFKKPQPPQSPQCPKQLSQLSQPPTPTPTLAATALITPIFSNAPATTTTTIGNTAPVILMSSAAPLPPSNFHHTTIAQHLQKLQCLKKSKSKTNLLIASTAPTSNETTTKMSQTAIINDQHAKTTTTTTTQQHSSTTNDLNKIPVNVIFRSSTTTTTTQSDSIKKEACNLNESKIKVFETFKQQQQQQPNKQQQQPQQLTHSSISNCSKINQIQKHFNNQQQPQQQQQTIFENPSLKKKQRNIKKLLPTTLITPTTTIIKAEESTSSSAAAAAVGGPSIPSNNLTKNIGNSKKRPSHHIPSNRYRKTNVFPTFLNERDRAALSLIPDISLSTKAVAIVKRPYKSHQIDFKFLNNMNDDLDADENDLPFCVQKHWFTTLQDPTLSGALGREGRIAEYKSVLRRQAMQLLATRSLQRLPYHIARKRLLCVDALLRKYRDHNKKTVSNGSAAKKQCEFEICKNTALTMTTFCQQHIMKNSKQNLFVMCSAKQNLKENNQQQQSPCDIPVLNIQKQYTPPLCYKHLGNKPQQTRNGNGNLNCYTQNNEIKQQWNNNNNNINNGITTTTTTINRKRKLNSNIIKSGYNNKLEMKNLINLNNNNNNKQDTPKRKNSTTSLESIASNSHSSYGSTLQQTATTMASVTSTAKAIAVPIVLEPLLKNISNGPPNMLSPPALAPLSYHNINLNQRQNQNHQQQHYHQHNHQPPHHHQRSFSSGTIDPVAEQEINKLVEQFALAAAATSSSSLSSNNNSNNNNNKNNNNNNNNINNNNNNNNNFNSFNFLNTNSNSNLTSSGVGSSSSLPSTSDELLTQDMLSNCENSSAYASSSEDTGLGELSESELNIAVGNIANDIDTNAIVNSFSNIHSGINNNNNNNIVGNNSSSGGVGIINCAVGGVVGGSGFNDDDVIPDEIPLGDDRLLEENDLVNVFDTLPVNLNELFSAVVRQDEREEIERALEIADKHLKTLQQTIGSDTDFLADFLNVDDDMLAETDDICSKMEIVSSVLPPNENLEAAALYLENADSVLSGGGDGEIDDDNHHHHHQHQMMASASNLNLPPTNCAINNGTNNASVMDIRGLLQT